MLSPQIPRQLLPVEEVVPACDLSVALGGFDLEREARRLVRGISPCSPPPSHPVRGELVEVLSQHLSFVQEESVQGSDSWGLSINTQFHVPEVTLSPLHLSCNQGASDLNLKPQCLGSALEEEYHAVVSHLRDISWEAVAVVRREFCPAVHIKERAFFVHRKDEFSCLLLQPLHKCLGDGFSVLGVVCVHGG